MKSNIVRILMFALFLTGPGRVLTLADPPLNPPPIPGNGHGTVNNQQGAPLDGGSGILIIAGTVYAARKIFKRIKAEKQKDTSG